VLTTQEQLRYGRQIMLDKIGEAGQQALQRSTVLIVGLGGLGCPVSLYLAAAGVGKIILCDGDRVEVTNLQRQVLFNDQNIGENKADAATDRLKLQNPYIDVEPIDEMFDDELAKFYLPQVDLVIDCTDKLNSRYLINQQCLAFKVPLVIGAATGFDGQSMFVEPSTKSACYQCVFPKKNTETVENCQTLGIVGPVLSIIGGIQALNAIKWLTGLNVTTNQLSLFDGLSQQWQQFKVKKSDTCPACANKALT
jgi:sulfur carrier protein ThiS adenylyltransferase